ncbi:MAG: hypothetical protein AB8H03_08570 [Saprospiraceae bacterium]
MKLLPSLTGILFLALGIIVFASCKDDDADDICATWDAEVQPIIEATCAYSGCHSGGASANMFLSAESNDFTSYSAIKSTLDNGKFVQRVLVDKDMPNPMFVPAGNPTELTQVQIDILQCWADDGFPES